MLWNAPDHRQIGISHFSRNLLQEVLGSLRDTVILGFGDLLVNND